MEYIKFPESNRALTAPAGMEDTVGTLHVYNDGNQSVSCWMPSQAEREAIAAGLPIWVGVQAGQSQPPIWVSGLKPYMAPVVHRVTHEVEQALADFAKCLPEPSYAGGRPQTGAELVAASPELRQYADRAELDPAQVYFVSSHAIQLEHLIALREAYRSGGQPAVVAYLKPYVHFLNATEAQPAQ